MPSIKSLPASLRSAFKKRQDQIFFGIHEVERDNKFLFVADYDEVPFVTGILFVMTDDDPDLWVPLADDGEEYIGDELPERWRALPDFLSEKIAFAARMHGLEI